jgi:hypothetical protein
MTHPDHYVRGKVDAPRLCELRVKHRHDEPWEVVATAPLFTGAHLDRLIADGAWAAEYEAVSGFSVHQSKRVA